MHILGFLRCNKLMFQCHCGHDLIEREAFGDIHVSQNVLESLPRSFSSSISAITRHFYRGMIIRREVVVWSLKIFVLQGCICMLTF